ncbi:3-deoxy-8-phosphooctulonate synthase [bacterium]|nr:3-deoxy-8-phosphooctulonate synthase [bacterium]
MFTPQSIALKVRLTAGGKRRPFWIAGPCVIESLDLVRRVADKLASISAKLNIPVVFKASFDKANRTAHTSFRGQGIHEGLEVLLAVKKEFGLPVLTDIHESSQAATVAEVVDILQIPAFLCRQTDLLEAASKTGRLLNVKKGQFLAPSNVLNLVEKLNHFNAAGYWVTERGVSFGYQRLVVDFAAFPEMEATQAGLILDITHSVQLPGGAGNSTGGIRGAIPYLARAGAAVGVAGFFAETHPDPSKALSDGPNAWPLDKMEALMAHSLQISEAAHVR